jgi:hypothetical protein
MNIIDLNNPLTINFKSNYLSTNEAVKEKKLELDTIANYNYKEDYESSADLIYKKLLDLSELSFSEITLKMMGAQAYDWIKLAENNPYIAKILFVTGDLPTINLNIISSDILSLLNIRRDMSSLDATQWGKGAEFVTKYGILPKAGTNTKNILNNSYQKLCENMNRAQSLQLRLGVLELDGTWDASSFSLGFEELIKKQTQEGTLTYGFVKGLSTSYNNRGDYKLYEALDAGKTAVGYPADDEVLGHVPDQPEWMISYIKTIFPPPLNLIYIISLYEKIMKYNDIINTVDNLAINQNINNNTFTTDYRGTPIDNKSMITSEGVLT